jgi:hypothetical protein
MKSNLKKSPLSLSASEIGSAKFLMKKMGIPKKELREIRTLYGVSFTKIVELMKSGKYKMNNSTGNLISAFRSNNVS